MRITRGQIIAAAIAVGIVIGLTASVMAGEVTIASDHDDTEHCTYRLYTGTDSGTYGEPVDVDEPRATLTDIPPNEWRYSVMTAVHPVGGESDPSEELRWALTRKPNPPTGLRKILQQIIGWLRRPFRRGLRVIG